MKLEEPNPRKMNSIRQALSDLPLRYLPLYEEYSELYFLHLLLINCGHEIQGLDYVRRGQTQYHGEYYKALFTNQVGNSKFIDEVYSLQYTLSGHGKLITPQRSYLLEKGSLMVVKSPEEYEYRATSEQWEFCFLSLSGSEAIHLLDPIFKNQAPVRTLNEKQLTLFYELLKNSFALERTGIFKLSSLCYQFCLNLLEDQYLKQNNETTALVKKIKQLCLVAPPKELNVNYLAFKMQYNRSYLSRKFKEESNQNLVHYIQEIKILRANEILSTRHGNIYEVANAFGYSSTSYFSKCYKKIMGYLPNQNKHSL